MLESDIRQKRDKVANLQVQNKNKQYLSDRESEIQDHKVQLERRALTLLSQDLSDQLSNLQENTNKLTGKITPFGFEQVLQEKCA